MALKRGWEVEKVTVMSAVLSVSNDGILDVLDRVHRHGCDPGRVHALNFRHDENGAQHRPSRAHVRGHVHVSAHENGHGGHAQTLSTLRD